MKKSVLACVAFGLWASAFAQEVATAADSVSNTGTSVQQQLVQYGLTILGVGFIILSVLNARRNRRRK